MPDLGAHLRSVTLEHPDPGSIRELYESLGIQNPPLIVEGEVMKYTAVIDTPKGSRILY